MISGVIALGIVLYIALWLMEYTGLTDLGLSIKDVTYDYGKLRTAWYVVVQMPYDQLRFVLKVFFGGNLL